MTRHFAFEPQSCNQTYSSLRLLPLALNLNHFTRITNASNSSSPISMATTTPLYAADSTESCDRFKAVKQFDESKIGVKGLVDSGICTIPQFFVHPPETLSDLKPGPKCEAQIPTVDLSGIESSDRHSAVVDQIRCAASTVGFFRIINHDIPLGVLNRTINSMKAFHEEPTEIKARVYRRDSETGVCFRSNLDLYHSKAASWRDTLNLRMGPTPPDEKEIPEVCRPQVIEWDREIERLGEVLMGLLSEGLGLDAGRLRELTWSSRRVIVGHYYPHCPQPDLTIGIASHSDPGLFTVLLQDHIGGLQVRTSKGWVDVKPVPGALVINIGDLLQVKIESFSLSEFYLHASLNHLH